MRNKIFTLAIDEYFKCLIQQWSCTVDLNKKIHQSKFNALKRQTEWHPVLLDVHNGNYILVDGFHRMYLAIERGDTEIKAWLV